jgi:steroid 5-alpha reductase family enzyme
MRKDQIISISGIAAALLLAVPIGYLGSHNGASFAGLPVFMLCGLVAFIVQWIMFIPAWIYQTEHYFDLTGSLTYITLTIFALLTAGLGNERAILIGALVVIWAARLGSFLFMRISKAGEDRRFRRMKTNFLQFLMTWTLQGLWVYITYAAGLAAMTSVAEVPIGPIAIAGAALWALGFGIEVVADRQKTAFRANPANQDKFIQSGLWAWSRHPNYFGEILLWCGIMVIAIPALEGLQYATLISPILSSCY